jgi:hypothetical protein
MKKQTAVEWLIEQIGWYNLELLSDLRFEIDKAKAMEKEQIIDAYDAGKDDHHHMSYAAQYYNETYGGDK